MIIHTLPLATNARLTEQIFDGGFFACFCKKGDSGNLSGAAVCYVANSTYYTIYTFRK
ncbi:MAG: hypothetical protein ACI9FB_004352 [Candidatus Azotimanducaceae bacterium]|jgi:hypothetical protein